VNIDFIPLTKINIEGLSPVIINIVPITNLPLLMGLDKNTVAPLEERAAL